MEKPERLYDWPDRLLLIGCGNMAGAMLLRWLDCGLPPYRVHVVRPSGKPVAEGVEVTTSLTEHIVSGTCVLLGCKPQQLAQVAAEMGPFLSQKHKLASILAGVPLGQLAESFPNAMGIVRCMPNLAVRYGRGVSVLYGGSELPVDRRENVQQLCEPLGLVEWLEDEALFDAATALAGCGPAFLYRFIDALAEGGAAIGLDRDMAARMAVATVAGAGMSASLSGKDPADLADAVASKGGMTRQGLDVLDQDAALKKLVIATLKAARDRGVELAELAKATA
ncbi:MAG: pyrroline-5-carboxylate reductase [Sphingobium sp.]|nr:pyrroline-5-carboxylate reductase [Sphingobium sp.]